MKQAFSLSQSLRVRVLIGTTVLVLAAIALAASVDARSQVDRAKAWASTHHVALSAMSLEEYAAYPEDYKRAILEEIAPADHSRLWRTQLSIVLKTEPTLTGAQRTFIQQTLDQATPESFAPGANHPEVCTDIATMFPDARVRKLVVTLGSAVKPVATWRPFLVSLGERLRASVVANADINYCNCRGLGLCECGLFDGCQDAPSCQPTSWCGCIWLGPCDQKTCQNGFVNMAMTTSATTTGTASTSGTTAK